MSRRSRHCARAVCSPLTHSLGRQLRPRFRALGGPCGSPRGPVGPHPCPPRQRPISGSGTPAKFRACGDRERGPSALTVAKPVEIASAFRAISASPSPAPPAGAETYSAPDPQTGCRTPSRQLLVGLFGANTESNRHANLPRSASGRCRFPTSGTRCSASQSASEYQRAPRLGVGEQAPEGSAAQPRTPSGARSRETAICIRR